MNFSVSLFVSSALLIASLVPLVKPELTKEEQEEKLTEDVFKLSKEFSREVAEFIEYKQKILPLIKKAQGTYNETRNSEKVQKHQLWNLIGDEFYENVLNAVNVIREGPSAGDNEVPEEFQQFEPKYVFDEEKVAQIGKFLEKRDQQAERRDKKHFGRIIGDAEVVIENLKSNGPLLDNGGIEQAKEDINEQIRKLKLDLETLDEISARRTIFQEAIAEAEKQLKDAKNVRNLGERAEGAALIELEKRRELDAIKYEIGKKNLVLIKLMGLLLNRFTDQNFILRSKLVENRHEIRVQREAVNLMVEELDQLEADYKVAAAKVPSGNALLAFVSNLFGGSKLQQLENDVKARVTRVYKVFDVATQELLDIPNNQHRDEARVLVAAYKKETTDTTVKMPKNQ